MGNRHIPAGKYTAIIMEAVIRECNGKYFLALTLSIMAGPHSYKKATKYLMFTLDQQAMAHVQFSRMGGKLTHYPPMAEDCITLIGNKLTIAVVDDDYHEVKIYEYTGKGNPDKFL